MSSLASFLPPHLVRSLARSGPPETMPLVERFPCAALLSDISGFTTLTERLQARGREGAEEIAAVVSGAFRPAIRAIERGGGSIQSFGGDSLFAVFPGASSTRRAVIAAEAIREVFAERGRIRTSAGSVRLGISQAVHHGDMKALHLGDATRRHYLLTGPVVTALARLEAAASGGRLLVSRTARTRARKERPTAAPRPPAPRAPADLLRSYLPQRLAPLLGDFEGEYRRAAVLFLETSGSAPRALHAFFTSLVDVLDAHEGMLLKTDLSAAGTKWLCVFGIPKAHEDDPERAALAALAVLGRRPRALSLRAALHGGIVANVLVGTRSRRSIDVMGDVVNTAARAMGMAAWGQALVTEEVRRLCASVETKPAGTHAVKGKSAPLTLHQLLKARPAARPLRVSTPMVGRDRELGAIVEVLRRAREGRGCTLGIKAEAGLGKSRLKVEASRVAETMGLRVCEGRAPSFGGMSYWAVAELCREALSIADAFDRQAILSSVRAAERDLGLKAVDRHHLAEVLGARYEDSPLRHLDAKSIRLNNMIAIGATFRLASGQRPLLLVLEDMHWADEMTREAAQWLAKGAGECAYALLLLYRPGYEPPQGTTELSLGELPEGAVEELLRAHMGAVSPRVAAILKERAGGNPFYVEELAHHLLEAGVLRLSKEGYQLLREPRLDDLPPSVESVIAARLDRLSAGGRKVAQYSAVIGRSFLFDLFARLGDVSRHARRGVDELVERTLAFERQREPHLEYIFKHALTRDVAYGTVLAARRGMLHRAVADAIEALFPGERDTFLAMIGHHREAAGQEAKARECYLAAARLALVRHAHEEAERLYRGYLALVRRPSAESVEARNELGRVLRTRGSMKEAEREHERALEEARGIGDRALEAASLRALGITRHDTGRMDEAALLYRGALDLARDVGERRLQGILLGQLANVQHEQGRMDEARVLYEQALAVHREVGNRHSEGTLLGDLANLHSIQGQSDRARALYEQALAIHEQTGDRSSEGIVLGNLANLCGDQGRLDEAGALYERALRIAREVGYRRFEGIVIGNLALLHKEQGRMDEAWALHERALEVAQEVGDRRSWAIGLCNMADLRRNRGRAQEALAAYEQALAVAQEVEDRRLQGHALEGLALLLQEQGLFDEAVTRYGDALDIARRTENLFLEGHVLLSMASLELLVADEISSAREREREAEAVLTQADDRLNGALLNCTGGHISLALGEEATPRLLRARADAEALRAGAESTLGKAIAMLERAIAAHGAGRPLVRGYCPEDLTEGQLRWLLEHDRHSS